MGDIAKLLSLAVARYEEECRQTKTTLPVVHAATEGQISDLSEDFAKRVTSPSKPNPNKRKRDKEQNNGSNNNGGSSNGNGGGSGSNNAAAAAETAAVLSNDIMIRNLYFTKEQIDFYERHKDSDNHEIVVAVFKLFGEVKDILERYESSDEEFTAEEVQSCLDGITNKFKDYFPEGMPNFGQVLSVKRMGALFNFAIDECMDYLGGGDFYDKMNPEEVCLMYYIRNTLRTCLLEGGTDSETKGDIFTTDAAAKMFKENVDMIDAIILCCAGTVDNPEGNKMSTLQQHLRTYSESFGFSGKDRMTFWWFVGKLNASLRPLYYHAKVGKAAGKKYVLDINSITAAKEGYGMDDGEALLSSPLLEVYRVPHPETIMSYLASHSEEVIDSYTDHKLQVLKLFKGLVYEVEEGKRVVIEPPTSRDQLKYFYRHGRKRGWKPSPEELAEAKFTRLKMYFAPRLARILAEKTHDRDLSKLTAAIMEEQCAQLEGVDRTNYEEIMKRMGNNDSGRERFVQYLKMRRVRQLAAAAKNWNKQVEDCFGLAELIDMSKLAAAAVHIHGPRALENVSIDTFTSEADRLLYQTYLDRYNGDDKKLSARLVEVRDQQLKTWDKHVKEGTGLAELNDMYKLAAAAVHIHGPRALENVSIDTFTSEADRLLFQKYSDKHNGDVKKLSARLVEVREQRLALAAENWKNLVEDCLGLAELIDLKRLAAVVSSYCKEEELEIDFSDYVKSFDFSILHSEETKELVAKYTLLYGGEGESKGQNELKKKLIETQQQYENSVFAEMTELSRLAREAAAIRPDLTANHITSPSTLDASLFKDKNHRESFAKLSNKYQGKCRGIGAVGNLPAQPCGKSLTVDNALQLIGGPHSSNKGSGFKGLKVCRDCDVDISYHKYIYHERKNLQQQISNGNLSKEQRDQFQERLQDIQSAYKAIHIQQLNMYYCTENEVLVKTNQLDNISLGECPLRSRVPMIMNDCGELRTQQRILAINGISVEGMSVDAVEDILSKQRENADTVTFYVGYLLLKNDEKKGLFAYQMRDKIEAAPRPLGIGVQMCPTTSLTKISTVKKEEKFSLRDKVEVEDYVLSINGEDVTDMKIGDIRDLLKEEGDKTLEILTPNMRIR